MLAQFVALLVALPDEVKTAILGFAVALVALVFDFAIGRFPWLEFLRKYQQESALALASAITVWLENALPTGFEDVAIKGVAFLLALLFLIVPYFGIRKALAARGVKSFQ